MKEVYYKIKSKCDLPMARLGFTYKDFDNVIQVGRDICVDFREDEKNIEKMDDIASRPGFMFFNNSEEGLEFWKNNPITFKLK